MEARRSPRVAAAPTLSLRRPSGLVRLTVLLAAPGYAGWLMAFLLAAGAYAAVANGAIGGTDQARLQAGISVALVAGGIGLGAGALSWGRAPLAWAGTGLLALFAVWSALSLAWSVAPDETWLAVNRAAAYAAVTALALIAAATIREGPRLTAIAIVALILPVALFALGGKIVPGIHFAGIDLDHTERFQRLREPIGYWNALGLLCVMATPLCIWAATDRSWRDGARIAALLVLTVLLVTIALTYSRGAALAYFAVVALMVAAGPDRLRRIVVGVGAAFAAVPCVAFAFGRHDLTTGGLRVAERSDDGLLLGALLVGTLVALVAIGRLVLEAEREISWKPRYTRLVWTSLVATAAVALLVGTVALAASNRGIGGTVSDQWREFKQVNASPGDPSRLVSVNGSNRWIWWSEAAGAFSDKPVAGWGAGSFPILHYLYRQHDAPTRSTHGVELQFLSETGLIGAALGLGGLAVLGLAAARGVRRATGPDRAARLTLLAVAVAWAVHSTYDWDWEIPAVTLPALVAGAVAAMPSRAPGRGAELLPVRSRRDEPPGWLLGGGVALVATCLAVSAILPALAEDRRLDSLVTASAGPGTLRRAEAEADLARRLDPLSIDPVLTEAAIASRRQRIARTEALLAAAVRRQPDNFRGWAQLTLFFGFFDAPRLANLAIHRWAELDPLTFAQSSLKRTALYTLRAPPSRSPTAFGTPLPRPPAPVSPALAPPAAPGAAPPAP